MTRIAILSASAAVTRAVEAVLSAGGMERVPAEAAQLVIRDMVHPVPMPVTAARIIALVARDDTDAPADSLVCPVKPAQLLQRIVAESAPKGLAIGGGWMLDGLSRDLVHADAAAVSLTEKECALLKALCAAYPSPVVRDALLSGVWGIHNDLDTHTLETHIYRLRSKLDGLQPTAGDIITEAGAYKLVLERIA